MTSAVSFSRNIRPLFTAMDVEHMRRAGVALDDIAYMPGLGHAESVYQKLSSKQMPPPSSGERPWPDANSQLFRDWMDGGFQPLRAAATRRATGGHAHIALRPPGGEPAAGCPSAFLLPPAAG